MPLFILLEAKTRTHSTELWRDGQAELALTGMAELTRMTD